LRRNQRTRAKSRGLMTGSATKQSKTAARPPQAALDCFASLAMTNFPVLALRFLFAPRALPTISRNGPLQRGRRSAERRVVRDRSAQSQRCRWAGSRRAPLLADALASRRSTAALARFLGLAQSGPALHGSGDVRYPGSQLLADLRRGRPGEFPNRPRMELRAPSRAPLPLASIGRHRLTSLKTSEMCSFSSPGGANPRNSARERYLLDPTKNHLTLFV
jgi:hypothetical protein